MLKQVESEQQAGWEVRRKKSEARWRKRVEAWSASALSQAEYCRRNGLAASDFSWWKHELARRDGRGPVVRTRKGIEDPSQFIPLQFSKVQAQGECELLLKSGRCLKIGSGTDPRWVAELVSALEGGVPC